MENFGSLTKEPVLHSVDDREPLKSFEKRSGSLRFSFSEGLSKGVLRKTVDLDSSWRSPTSLDREHHLLPRPPAGLGASATHSCSTWTSPCCSTHPHLGLPVLLCPSLEWQALTYAHHSIPVASTDTKYIHFFLMNVKWNYCSGARDRKSGSG